MPESDTPENTPFNRRPGAGNGGIVPPPEYRWRPGQTGNPGGRPKKRVTEAYLEELTETQLRAWAKSIVGKAIAGDVAAAREVTDRVEGTAPKATEDREADSDNAGRIRYVFLQGNMTEQEWQEKYLDENGRLKEAPKVIETTTTETNRDDETGAR